MSITITFIFSKDTSEYLHSKFSILKNIQDKIKASFPSNRSSYEKGCLSTATCLTFRASAIFQQHWTIFLYCSFFRITLQKKKSRKAHIKACGNSSQNFTSRSNFWIPKYKEFHSRVAHGHETRYVKAYLHHRTTRAL